MRPPRTGSSGWKRISPALQERADAMTAKWKSEKDKLSSAAELQKQLDKAKNDLAEAIRRGDFQRAGELQYSVIPQLEGKLQGRPRRRPRA